MMILALDCATRTGWAMGKAGERPTVGAFRLKKPDDDWEVAGFALAQFIKDKNAVDPIDLLVYEAPLDPRAKADMGTKDGRNVQSSASIILPWVLVGGIGTIAGFYEITTQKVSRQMVLKHFTGAARWGARDRAKEAVIKRAVQLKLVPYNCKDDDICDAVAVHDYASHKWGRYQRTNLDTFNGRML